MTQSPTNPAAGDDRVEVTQADRDAVTAFHSGQVARIMAGDKTLGENRDAIEQAFARHRVATEARLAQQQSGDVGAICTIVAEFCHAAEYTAGCDSEDGVDADFAASEILSSMGSPMAVVYAKARSFPNSDAPPQAPTTDAARRAALEARDKLAGAHRKATGAAPEMRADIIAQAVGTVIVDLDCALAGKTL